MTKHTIELTGDFAITKGPRDKAWLAEVSVDLAKVPESIVLDLALHGLKQKVADAASGAKTKDEAIGPMQKALDAILAGEWSSRGQGGDGTRGLAVVRLYRAAMDKATLKRFNALAAEDQLAKATANVTDESAIAAEVAKIEAEREQRRVDAEARKAQVAELAKGMKFDF
jgi:hypothetical protein